jgi:hypothetical protein
VHRRFALHFVPVERLAKEVAHAGFEHVGVQMAGPAFAYASGVRG